MLSNYREQSPAIWLNELITDFVANSHFNSLNLPGGERAWDAPLVGFASGDDQIFKEFKHHIGEFYWTPEEIFHLTFPDVETTPNDLSVISWILPQTRITKDENAGQKVFSSLRWAAARDSGEKFNVVLRRYMSESLQKAGIPAVAPMLSPHWSEQTSERYGFASNWSERHAAHAAGLGTFGLCDGLITTVGKAIRAGSVVAMLKVPVTPRPYQDYHAYCLFYSHGTCQKCVPRCPVKALSSQGHDKIKCGLRVDDGKKYNRKNYGIEIEGCGLCQVGVPCESHIPTPEEG